MVAERGGGTRLLLFVLISAMVLAGLVLVVAGFAAEKFALSVLGVAMVVVATIALVILRPQQTNWIRRFGSSALGVGLAIFAFGAFGWGDAPFRLAMGGSFAIIGLSLLALDAIRRRSRTAKARAEAV